MAWSWIISVLLSTGLGTFLGQPAANFFSEAAKWSVAYHIWSTCVEPVWTQCYKGGMETCVHNFLSLLRRFGGAVYTDPTGFWCIVCMSLCVIACVFQWCLRVHKNDMDQGFKDWLNRQLSNLGSNLGDTLRGVTRRGWLWVGLIVALSLGLYNAYYLSQLWLVKFQLTNQELGKLPVLWSEAKSSCEDIQTNLGVEVLRRCDSKRQPFNVTKCARSCAYQCKYPGGFKSNFWDYKSCNSLDANSPAYMHHFAPFENALNDTRSRLYAMHKSMAHFAYPVINEHVKARFAVEINKFDWEETPRFNLPLSTAPSWPWSDFYWMLACAAVSCCCAYALRFHCSTEEEKEEQNQPQSPKQPSQIGTGAADRQCNSWLNANFIGKCSEQTSWLSKRKSQQPQQSSPEGNGEGSQQPDDSLLEKNDHLWLDNEEKGQQIEKLTEENQAYEEENARLKALIPSGWNTLVDTVDSLGRKLDLFQDHLHSTHVPEQQPPSDQTPAKAGSRKRAMVHTNGRKTKKGPAADQWRGLKFTIGTDFFGGDWAADNENTYPDGRISGEVIKRMDLERVRVRWQDEQSMPHVIDTLVNYGSIEWEEPELVPVKPREPMAVDESD